MKAHGMPFYAIFLPWEDKLAAIQTDIGWLWDPKYHYHLELTNTVPIWVKPTHLRT